MMMMTTLGSVESVPEHCDVILDSLVITIRVRFELK